MKRSKDRLARKHRMVPPPPAKPRPGRRRRWCLWGGILGVLALVGYLGYSGRLISRGDWQMATASIRSWFKSPPPPEDDPEEKESPALNTRTPPGKPPADDLVWIPGGWFWRGCEEFPDAVPLRKIYVDGFWMAKTEVTNRQWREFAEETGYLTVAERKPKLSEFPRLSPAALGFQPHYLAVLAVAPTPGFPAAVPWGAVFHTWPALEPFSLVFSPPDFPLPDLNDHTAWWRDAPGACWKHPKGPRSSIAGKDDHPVVHICWHDAVAYCEWKGKKTGKRYRLPTEAEWEFAARGGLDRKLFCWGEELIPGGKWMCNIWQGEFPHTNLKLDGFEETAPVASFPANGYGLFDMAGNAWEWCSDWYTPDYYKQSPRTNPPGPPEAFDPREPAVPKRVQRGGSFLCCENYCVRFLPGARGKGEPNSAANHIGFRCAVSP